MSYCLGAVGGAVVRADIQMQAALPPQLLLTQEQVLVVKKETLLRQVEALLNSKHQVWGCPQWWKVV